MKTFLGLLFSLMFFSSPNLAEVRILFENAANNKINTQKLYTELDDYNPKNQTILAYKGASKMLYARYNGNKESKRKLLIDGSNLVDNAVKSEPKNLEIRLV